MRIIQFLHGTSLGGMEKFCLDLSNRLAKDNTVLLIADKSFKKYITQDVNFVPIDPKKSRNNPIFLWYLYSILRKFQPDIIHAHKQRTIEMLKRLSPFLGLPFVATKHDTQYKKAFIGLRYAITISNETTDTVKAENIYKIYNGIEYQKPKKIKMSDVFNIVAIGGLRKVKGYDKLLHAVSRLNFEYHLSIVGEGDERGSLEELIKNLDIEHRVSLVGFQSNVNDYIYSSDLQVISSESEGFSLAMIEGLFYGKMVLSTKVSGCNEILSHAMLADIDNFDLKIKDIYDNYEVYTQKFKEIKEQYSNRLTIDACAKEHIRVYDEIRTQEKI